MRDDELIDAAAHAMTRGEPSAQLRIAVRARIDTRTWPAVAVWPPAVAVAAAVALAVVVWWPPFEPAPPQPAAVVTPAPATVAPPAVSRIETSATTPPKAVPRTHVTRSVRPLDPIAPLVIEPMTTPLIAVTTSSGVMPIEIDDLQIEPLQVQ